MAWYGWRPYVPVAERRLRASRKMEKLRRKGLDVQGVQPRGRSIVETFWGQAWCRHLERFSDYANRLPRGRTYVRNGSVCHLEISPGFVKAMVSGSELYHVSVGIAKLSGKKWRDLKRRCTQGIGSLLELLQGKLSHGVMQVVTDRDRGLFPLPREIRLDCDCPDWASMCKHVAAVMYGVGVRLDDKPDLLFRLRGVDPEELIGADAVPTVPQGKRGRRIAKGALSEVFGIDLADDADASPQAMGRPANQRPKRATGEAVAALRRRFGMSRSQFARLLGVSVPAVGTWEHKKGSLALRARSLRGWIATSRLSKPKAWNRLEELSGV